MVIDVRNNYETRIGKFKGAVDPLTASFREFPYWVEQQFQLNKAASKQSEMKKQDSNEMISNGGEITSHSKPKKVAMYCTGGIRCEKASSFLLSKGFDEVNLYLHGFFYLGLSIVLGFWI